MGYHMIALVLAPFALCLSGALASLIWPSRIPLAACLVPAWAMAALLFGLREIRGEIAGPVLTWCRIGTFDLALGSVALPVAAAVTVACQRRDAVPRRTPFRFGLLQALVATVAVLPLPMIVPLVLWTQRGAWRSIHWAAGVTLATVALAVLWPKPGVIDLLAAAILAVSALGIRRAGDGGSSLAGRGWTALCLLGAVLSLVRTATLLG